jgi:hypothetical protein
MRTHWALIVAGGKFHECWDDDDGERRHSLCGLTGYREEQPRLPIEPDRKHRCGRCVQVAYYRIRRAQ